VKRVKKDDAAAAAVAFVLFFIPAAVRGPRGLTMQKILDYTGHNLISGSRMTAVGGTAILPLV